MQYSDNDLNKFKVPLQIKLNSENIFIKHITIEIIKILYLFNGIKK